MLIHQEKANKLAVDIRAFCKEHTKDEQVKDAVAITAGALSQILSHMMGFMDYAVAGKFDLLEEGIKAMRADAIERMDKQLAELREDAKVWKKEFENDKSDT